MKHLLFLALITVALCLAGPRTKAVQTADCKKDLAHWQKKFGTKYTVNLTVVTEPEMEALTKGTDLEGANLVGLSIEEAPGRWSMYIRDERDYPWFSNPRRVRIDQRNSVVHEFLHVMIGRMDEEGFVRTVANHLVKGPN